MRTISRLVPIAVLALLVAFVAARPRADEGKSLVLVSPPEAPSSTAECNRDCLYALIDKYFDAMLARYPAAVAMAPQVKYTENEQRVKPGEGIWKTFSGRGSYRVYLADPATGQAAYYGEFSEDGGLLEGVMALRVKVTEHRLTEIQLITVREEKRPKGGLGLNTAGIMTPRMINELDAKQFLAPSPVLLGPIATPEKREQLVNAAEGYFAAFEKSQGSLAALDTQCSRRENGVMATNNTDGPIIDPAQPSFRLFSGSCAQELDRGFFSALWKVRTARPLVIDEKQGLVLTLAFFDNEGAAKSVPVKGVGPVVVPGELRRSITFMAPQLFKIDGGKIRTVEGLSWPVPFGMRSAWGP